MKMQRLGTVKVGASEFIAFYNEDMKAVDYFYKSKNNNDVECWTLTLNAVKGILKKAVKTKEDLKESFRSIMVLLFPIREKVNIFNFQVFPRQMWEDCVERDFKGYGVMAMEAPQSGSEE